MTSSQKIKEVHDILKNWLEMFRRVMKVPSYQISTSNYHYFGFYKKSCTAGHFDPPSPRRSQKAQSG